MQIYKRIRLTRAELMRLRRDCEGYIWAAVDPRRCVMSIGDDYVQDMRDLLLSRRCRTEDIYGVGIDLRTGEIQHLAQINRRNPSVDNREGLSAEQEADVNRTVHYFFDRLPIVG